MKKMMLAAAVAFAISGVAVANAEEDTGGGNPPVTPPGAAQQDGGTVTFTGSIIDAPCSMDAESADQLVELGTISNSALQAENGTGSSTPKFFHVKLDSCSVSTAKTVQTTFTGTVGANGHLAVTGKAKGAGIVITDTDGKPLELGKPSAGRLLQSGNNDLQFGAYMQGDGDKDAIVPGEFRAVADFRLSYQ